MSCPAWSKIVLIDQDYVEKTVESKALNSIHFLNGRIKFVFLDFNSVKSMIRNICLESNEDDNKCCVLRMIVIPVS